MKLALLFAFGLSALALTSARAETVAPFQCVNPVAIDGDTIACGSQRPKLHIRLVGVDAPEMPGHCRPGRICVAGNPYQSKAYLQGALNLGPVWVYPITRDRFSRIVARVVTADGANVSCTMLEGNQAFPKIEWDTRRGARQDCPTEFLVSTAAD